MDHDQQLRNLRDFLLVYNRMTEICFQRCSSNFNYRNLTMDEEQCVDSCAGKLIRSNHRLMSTYVQLMPRMVQRRMEEMESKAAENAKAAEAAATSGAVDTATLNASPAFETPITSLQPPQLPPSVTEVAPEIHDSVLKSAGLAIPPDTTATEVKLSAATPLTPKTEGLNIPVLNEAGPLHTAGFPGLPESGVQIDFGSPKPASSPENVLRAATSASVSEGMAGQDRPSEVPPPSSQ